MPLSSLAQVRDALVTLQSAELSLADRRRLAGEVEAFVSAREGNYTLQELLTRVNEGLHQSAAGTANTTRELEEWRPTVLRLMAAEAERVELDNTERREGRRFTTWLMGAVDAKTVILIIAILAAGAGVGVSISSGGISVTPAPSPVTIEEAR